MTELCSTHVSVAILYPKLVGTFEHPVINIDQLTLPDLDRIQRKPY